MTSELQRRARLVQRLGGDGARGRREQLVDQRDLLPHLIGRPFGRHHVLLVPDDAEDRLISVLNCLDDRGIEVEEVTARYR